MKNSKYSEEHLNLMGCYYDEQGDIYKCCNCGEEMDMNVEGCSNIDCENCPEYGDKDCEECDGFDNSEEQMFPKEMVEAVYKEPRSFFAYAAHKVGKTDICLALTRQLNGHGMLFDLDDGCSTYKGYYVSADKKLNIWQRIGKYNEWINGVKAQGYPFKVGILDNLSRLDDMCEWEGTWDYMESMQGKSFNCWDKDDDGKTVNYISYGDGIKRGVIAEKGKRKPKELWTSVISGIGQNGYQWSRNAFNRRIEEFMSLFEYTIFLGYIKEKYEESRGTTVNTIDIDLTGKLKTSTARKVDAIALITVKPSERFLSFKVADTTGGAGTRCSYLRDKIIPISTLNPDTNEITYHWENIYPELIKKNGDKS